MIAARLLVSALFAVFISSCGDQPVMVLPKVNEMVGTWECEALPKRTEAAIGSRLLLGEIVLKGDGKYSVSGFPISDPLRLINRRGTWNLIDPSMTPSGVASIELDGVFLSIRRRGDRYVLYYPIDVLQGYSAEYMQTSAAAENSSGSDR